MATRPKNSNYGSETIVIGGEEEEDYSNIVEDLVPKYDPFSGPSHRLDEEEEPDERISEITLHVDEDEEEEPDERISEITLHVDEDEEDPFSGPSHRLDEDEEKTEKDSTKEDTSASDALSGIIEAGFGALLDDPVKTIKGIANIKLPFMDMTVGDYFKTTMNDLVNDVFNNDPEGYQYGDSKEWHPFTKEMNFIEDLRKKGAFDGQPEGISDMHQANLIDIQENPKYGNLDRDKLAQEYVKKIVLQLDEPKVPNSDIKVVEDKKVIDVPLPKPEPRPSPQPKPKPKPNPNPKPNPEPDPGDKRKDRIDLKDYENKRIKHFNRLKRMPNRQVMDVYTRMTGFEPIHDVPDQGFNIFYGSGRADPWFK